MDAFYIALIITVILELIIILFFRKAFVWLKINLYGLALKTIVEIDDLKRMLNERKSNRKDDSRPSEEPKLRTESDVKE